MLKRYVPLLTASLVLIGCSDTESETEEVSEADVTDVQDAESEYFVENIQTSFTVNPTKLNKLTEEQEWIVEDINAFVSDFTSEPRYDDEGNQEYYSDRELVDIVASDYPEYTSEELHDMRDDYYTNIHFGDFGEFYVDHKEFNLLEQDVVESNLKANDIMFSTGSRIFSEDGSRERNMGTFVLDGKLVEYEYVLEFTDDYTEATLVSFDINGEDVFK